MGNVVFEGDIAVSIDTVDSIDAECCNFQRYLQSV